MIKSPISRSDWASFDWKEAQTKWGYCLRKMDLKYFKKKN